jgi:hypothetical protein
MVPVPAPLAALLCPASLYTSDNPFFANEQSMMLFHAKFTFISDE